MNKILTLSLISFILVFQILPASSVLVDNPNLPLVRNDPVIITFNNNSAYVNLSEDSLGWLTTDLGRLTAVSQISASDITNDGTYRKRSNGTFAEDMTAQNKLYVGETGSTSYFEQDNIFSDSTIFQIDGDGDGFGFLRIIDGANGISQFANNGISLNSISTTYPFLILNTGDTNIQVGDILGRITAQGVDSSGRTGGFIEFVASDLWGAHGNDAPTDIRFYTQSNGNINNMTGSVFSITENRSVVVNSFIPLDDKTFSVYGTTASTGNYYFRNDNTGVVFGGGADAKITYDGSNLVFDTDDVGTGIAYFSNNVSAENLIDRSWYWDKSLGRASDFVQDSDQINSDKDLHDFEKVTYQVVDTSKPVIVKETIENCGGYNDVLAEDGSLISVYNASICYNQTIEEVTYPYMKNETGRSISAVSGKHEQVLKEIIDDKGQEMACILVSNSWSEYKSCRLGVQF